MRLRLVRHLLLVLALLAVVPAAASAACGETIIDDYLDDGRVDGKYTQACFDQALNGLDDDLREYTNAETDIRSAKQRARNNDNQPPATTQSEAPAVEAPPESDRSSAEEVSPSPEEDGGASGGGGSADSGDEGGGRSSADQPAAPTEADGASEDEASAENREIDTGGVLGVETEVAQPEDVTSDGPLQQALRDVGPAGGDDLPVPVLVLGGLAILLIAVGAGGIVLRRLQSR